jgi:hypothetical protein
MLYGKLQIKIYFWCHLVWVAVHLLLFCVNWPALGDLCNIRAVILLQEFETRASKTWLRLFTSTFLCLMTSLSSFEPWHTDFGFPRNSPGFCEQLKTMEINKPGNVIWRGILGGGGISCPHRLMVCDVVTFYKLSCINLLLGNGSYINYKTAVAN